MLTGGLKIIHNVVKHNLNFLMEIFFYLLQNEQIRKIFRGWFLLNFSGLKKVLNYNDFNSKKNYNMILCLVNQDFNVFISALIQIKNYGNFKTIFKDKAGV